METTRTDDGRPVAAEAGERPTVAVLGTGIMGAAMARNIAAAGMPVRAWNRTPARAEALRDAGVVAASSLADAVAGADVVVTMLFDASAVGEVMAEARPHLRPGAAWLQMTTIGVEDVASLADLAREAGVLFYDAPVSGTRGPAEAGKLVVMAAGPEDGRALIGPVLDAVGARTVWTGDDGGSGASTRLKLVVNSWVLAVSNAAGEMVALAGALGVDPQRFFEVLDGGPLDLPFLRVKADIVASGDYRPNFAVDTSGKDAHLMLDAASVAGLRLDGIAAYSARLDRVAAQGRASEDMAAAYFASFPDAAE